MRNKIGLVIFLFFVVVGVFFRLWRLDRAPISLFGDEIDVGLQGYSILTTGRDYLGNSLPIMFHSFSEYRLPMQLYIVVPFVKLFGLNEIGVRGPAVLSGLLSLIIFYFLVKELCNKKIAAIATVFLTFSPWHFNFSRQANDAGILLPFVLAGTLFFVKGLKKYKYLFLSAIFFALSFYTYAIAAVFTPVFVLPLTIIYLKEIFRYGFKKLSLVVLLGFVVFLPYLVFTLRGVTKERFSVISVSSGLSVFQEVVDKRRWSDSILTRVLYNTKTISIDRAVNNYLMSFSSTFLFSLGDPNMRQGIEGFGQMYCFEILFLFAGIAYAFFTDSKNSKKNYLAILCWMLVAPIPSSLTKDGGYHAARLILMLPPLVLFSSIGFEYISSKLMVKKGLIGKVVFVGFILFMLFDYVKFMHRYFVVWPNESWRFWHYGYKDTLRYVKDQEQNYSRVVFNSTYEPMLPRFLFYYQYDMNKFQKEFMDDKFTNNVIARVNGFKLGEKYIFGELVKPIEDLSDKSTLVVASAERDITDPTIFGGSRLKLLYNNFSPTGVPIFYVFTGK